MDKFKEIIRYLCLAGYLWALPSFVLAYISPSLGSPVSYMTIGLLVVYFFLEKDRGPVLWAFLLLGLSYYIIGGLNYPNLSFQEYSLMVLKYLIVIIGGAAVLRKTSLTELFVFLLIGAASISIHAILFPTYNAGFNASYGRYSGFYLNPNFAGAISLMGFALSFGIRDKRLKYFGQLIFTIGGFFTFSRYFLGMWIMINFLSVFISRKNLIVPLLGVLALVGLFAIESGLQLNKERFNAIKSVFSDSGADTKTLGEDSRTATWATYQNVILDKPIWGNGYKKLQGMHFGLIAGVHNTYLLVIGEAGVFPFLILVGIYIFLLIKAFKSFKTEPHYSLLALVLFTALLVTHNYFDKFSLLFMSMYLYLIYTEVKYIDTENDQNI